MLGAKGGRRGEKHTAKQIQETSENPFIPCDSVAAPTLTKMIFNNELVGGDTLWGREGEKEREGENLSHKKINYKHFCRDQRQRMAVQSFGDRGRESGGGRKLS